MCLGIRANENGGFIDARPWIDPSSKINRYWHRGRDDGIRTPGRSRARRLRGAGSKQRPDALLGACRWLLGSRSVAKCGKTRELSLKTYILFGCGYTGYYRRSNQRVTSFMIAPHLHTSSSKSSFAPHLAIVIRDHRTRVKTERQDVLACSRTVDGNTELFALR